MDFSRSKYTEEIVKEEIFKVMKSVNIKTMPSRSDFDLYSKSTALTNIIMKTGGFHYWANKIGLPLKKSATIKGIEYEEKCMDYLNNAGLKAEMTPMKFPYDILVNKKIKIDVKISNGYDGDYFFFAFNLESNLPRSDFYVFYCVNEKKTKTLVIPSYVLYGNKQLSVGINSKYDIYCDRWDLINKQLEMLETIKVN